MPWSRRVCRFRRQRFAAHAAIGGHVLERGRLGCIPRRPEWLGLCAGGGVGRCCCGYGGRRGPARHGDIATAITRQRARFLQRIAEVDHATVRLLARAPLEDHARRRALAVNQLVGGVIDRQDGAVERDPGEQPARTRPRPDFRLELPIGGGGGIAADRSRGDAGVGAERDLAVDDRIQAALTPEHQHDVGRLHAGLDNIVNGKVTLGADAGVAAGPVGRNASTATDGQLKAEIWSWSRARGLFAGIALDGAVLSIDDEANESVYGRDTTPRMIFEGRATGQPSTAVVDFRDRLEEASNIARTARSNASADANARASAPRPVAGSTTNTAPVAASSATTAPLHGPQQAQQPSAFETVESPVKAEPLP